MPLSNSEREAITRRVAAEAARLLEHGWQGGTFEVPELDEMWTISREPS